MVKGQIVGGEFSKILVRQKSDVDVELGELMIAESSGKKIMMQVYDLLFGSQISQQNLELVSGLQLEDGSDENFFDSELRNYNLALLKSLITVDSSGVKISKSMPSFFSKVREVEKDDLKFITRPKNPFFVGNLRSGSKVLDVPVYLDGKSVLSHHVLVPATTGRGKSNLTSCILWDNVDKSYAGVLVLDPHDEYYGRDGLGLKDHPSSGSVVYYTPRNPPVGAMSLKINIRNLKPQHFDGAVDWSMPQKDALSFYYKKYGREWIEAIVMEKPLDNLFNEATLAVVKRKVMGLLDLSFSNFRLGCNGVFDLSAGETTIGDIVRELELGKIVVVDTSNFGGSVEILVGSLIASEILSRYRYYKFKGELDDKPVISIVLEEAPRVLGKEALERGPNIFSTIAREGRKFKVGLFAITQLPSLIPRQILANMNTKIILGIEMAPERQAIIESAAQDLSNDNRTIASLDKGEAIITSNFAKFAMPIKIPLFSDLVKKQISESVKKDFSAIR
jgi:uncharacterized protein